MAFKPKNTKKGQIRKETQRTRDVMNKTARGRNILSPKTSAQIDLVRRTSKELSAGRGLPSIHSKGHSSVGNFAKDVVKRVKTGPGNIRDAVSQAKSLNPASARAGAARLVGGVAGRAGMAGLAGQVGYAVGSKIYNKYEPQISKGVDYVASKVKKRK